MCRFSADFGLFIVWPVGGRERTVNLLSTGHSHRSQDSRKARKELFGVGHPGTLGKPATTSLCVSSDKLTKHSKQHRSARLPPSKTINPNPKPGTLNQPQQPQLQPQPQPQPNPRRRQSARAFGPMGPGPGRTSPTPPLTESINIENPQTLKV